MAAVLGGRLHPWRPLGDVHGMRLYNSAKHDNAGLMAIAQCARGNVEQEAENVGASLASMGKLIGLINLFLGMIGASQVPDLSGLSGKPLDQVIVPLDELVVALRGVRDSIPVP